MPHATTERGSTILAVVGAIVVLTLLAAAVSRFTGSAGYGVVAGTQAQAAYYASLSGLEYARSLDADGLEAVRASPDTVYTLPGGNQFRLIVDDAAGGAYPVRSLGTAAPGTPLVANYVQAGNVVPKVTEHKGGDYVIHTNGALTLPQSAKVNGSVAGKDVQLSQYAAVTGDVISSTSASLGQYAKVGGYVCAASGNVMLNQYAEVTEDVSANGAVALGQYAKAWANAYATKTIDLSQYAQIALTGQAGGKITLGQYATVGTKLEYTPTTVTCPITAAPKAPAITSAATANVPASNASKPIPAGSAYKAWSTKQHDSAYLTSGTYAFASIQYSQYMDLYLDVSSGQPLTILSAGAITTGQYTYVHVKTADTGGSYLTMEQIEALPTATKAKVRAAAKLIYMGAETTMQWSQYGTWLGTLYAQKSLATGQFFQLTGTLASPGTMNLSSEMEIYEYVLADYAKENWR